MKAECAATIFHVADVETSLKYYTEVLGFAVDLRYKDMAGVEYGPILIYLSGPRQDVKKMAGEGSVYIFCDEVDEYYAAILAKGAILNVPIDDRGYGMRDFGIKDPDGNAISFGREIKV